MRQLAALSIVLVTAIGMPAYLHNEGEGSVSVINPKSYPLVGGIWTVGLDIADGGDLRVEAANATRFGHDVEFVGMYQDGSGDTLPPTDPDSLIFKDVSEGAWSFQVRVLTDGPHHLLFDLGGEIAYASNTASIANVTSITPDGRYGQGSVIDVRVNFAEPVSLDPFIIRDSAVDANGGKFSALRQAVSVATAEISSRHYALVAAEGDGIQIIDITDPTSPTATHFIRYEHINDIRDSMETIITTEISSRHYAIVYSHSNANGVQIIDITDPTNPTGAARIGWEGFDQPFNTKNIATAEIDSSHYLLHVGAHTVVIANITDPANPTNLGFPSSSPHPSGPASAAIAEIDSGHYALVTSYGTHKLLIYNITDPADPAFIASPTDGSGFNFRHPLSVAIAEIDSSHYALVGGRASGGIQIINVTDPASPTAVAFVAENGRTLLDTPASITIAEINSRHYALVANYLDPGVQIIDITDPASPTATTSVAYGGHYPALYLPESIIAAEINSRHYAITTSFFENSIQLIDVTDPSRPHNPLLPHIKLDLDGDRRATYDRLSNGNSTMVFEYAVKPEDQTNDLAYLGTDALRLGNSGLTYASNSTDLSGSVSLPGPGEPNSLSHNKQIVLGVDTIPPTFSSATYTTGDGLLTITFSEPISGIVHYDRLRVRDAGQTTGGILLNGTQSATADGATITITLSHSQRTAVSGMATPQLDIQQGAVSDQSGNKISASTGNQITVNDTTGPSPALSTNAASPTNAALITVTVDFGESINATTFDLGDITVSNGTVSSLAQSSGNRTFTFALTPDDDGTVEASIPAGAVTDLAGNPNAASDPFRMIFDRTGPSPVLSTTAASPTNAALITVTVDFGESINATTFAPGDISVTGGSVVDLAPDPSGQSRTFAFTLAPDRDGQVTTSIPAGAIRDLAGNNNTASNQLSIISDRTAFRPALSTNAASPTNTASISVTVDFGESINITTFEISDIAVTGGTASSLTHSSGNRTFTFTLTPDNDGTVEASIPAGRVADPAGNANAASDTFRMIFDRIGPSPELTTTAASPTNAALITVTVDFGESINATTFAPGDISVTGGSIADLAPDPSGQSRTFTFTLTPASDGAVEASIPAGAVRDLAGNPNAVSDTFRMIIDRIGPSPELTTTVASPTNAALITVTVDFGESINTTTFEISDIAVTGGTASSLAHSSNSQTFTFELTPDNDGTVEASIPAGRVADPAGNANAASNLLEMYFDRTSPRPALSTATFSPTNAALITVTVDFGESINATTFATGDVSVTGGSIADLAPDPSGQSRTFTFTLTPASDGAVEASIPAGAVRDLAGNPNAVSDTFRMIIDRIGPSPELTTTAASPTNAALITVTVDFGESINTTTFEISDIAVTGGTASSLTQEGSTARTFTFTVAPTSDGTVEASIPAGAVRDLAGNPNAVSDTFRMIIDRIGPSPELTTTAASPTNAALITVTVDFGESINATTFGLSDIAVTGGTASSLTQEGSTARTFTFTVAPTSDGTVEASIPAGAVRDLAGNNNTASNQLSIISDRTASRPALSTTAASPTNAALITVTVDFGESINATTFATGDVSVTGGSIADLAPDPSGQSRTFTFTVAPTSDGTVEASIPAGAVRDLAGNPNAASDSFRMIFDRTGPSPELTTTAASPTNAALITVTVDFGESINATTFGLSDIAVTGGTASSLTQEGSTARTFTFTVAPTSDGTVEASIPAGAVRDLAGNNNTASNQLSIISDRTASRPALSTTAASPTNAASISVTVDFGESINATTFDLGDITVSNGTASSLTQEGSTARTFTFTVAPTSDETVKVSIPSGRVGDSAGNANIDSNRLEIVSDRTAPGPSLSSHAASPTSATSVTVTVDFGEGINATTFDLGDITVSNGTASSLTPERSTARTFTFIVTPNGFGTVGVSIPAGAVRDLAGNANTASNSIQVTFEMAVPPVIYSDLIANVTSITPDGRYGQGDVIDVRVNFAEPVSLDPFIIRDSAVDANGGKFSALSQAVSVATAEISSRHYALVAAEGDGIQIIDITDPTSPTATHFIRYEHIDDIRDSMETIITTEISSRHYAIVYSHSNANGVQIIDITDPTNPTGTARIGWEGFDQPFTTKNIATAEIDSSHYLLHVGAHTVAIANITDPANPTILGSPSSMHLPEGPASVAIAEIDSGHYALVTSYGTHQLLIYNITDPADRTFIASPTDGSGFNFRHPLSVAIAEIDSSHYALVGGSVSDGIQIINVTDPASPTAVAFVDKNSRTLVDRPQSITIAEINSRHYALVANYIDPGVQIIDITDPASPTATASVAYGGHYPALYLPGSIIAAEINSRHYAITTSFFENSIQLIDVTDPSRPHNPLLPHIKLDLDGDRRATYDRLSNGNSTMVFEYAVKPEDQTNDLAYLGTDALRLGNSGLTYASNSTDLSGSVSLPGPGEPNSLSHNKQIVLGVDTIPPTFSSATYTTGDGLLTITFSEPISGIVHYDRLRVRDAGQTTGGILLNGTQSATADGATITITLSHSQRTAVSGMATPQLDIQQGAVSDQSGNKISASTGNQITVNDTTGPSPALSTNAASPTNAALITVTVDFGESINATTFAPGDVSVTGGSIADLAPDPSGQSRTFTFTVAPASDGAVEASIPAGAIRDLAGNNNTASNQLSIISDRTAFRPTLSTNAASPTNTASISVTVDFGESINITTFEISDIAVTGGTASSLTHSSGNRTFTFTLTPDNDGTVEASIPAGRVADPAGNANAASNLLEMDFDGTSPKPALSTTAASPTNAASISVTVDFGESINATTFAPGDVSVTGGSIADLAPDPSGQSRTFTFTLTPDNDGTVEASIPAGRVADPAGNANAASNQLSIISDRTAFRPALSTTAASPTNTASISVTVDFGESINITTFEISDIAVTGGTASSLTHSSGNRTFTFTLTPDNDGTVEASIPAGRVADPAGNANAASNLLEMDFDGTSPKPALSTTAASPTNAASISVTVDFGESINATTFDLSDITVSNGTASSLTHSSGNRTFTFTLTPDNDGTVEASIPAGAIRDLAGNNNTASNQLSIISDRTAFRPALSTTAASPTNTASISVTVDFGESINITTFEISDIAVTGGTASSLTHSSGNRTFTFTLTPDNDGTVEASIPAGRVADPAGNANAASNLLEMDFDGTSPKPALSTTAASPTNAASISVTVDFGESINATTFDLSDITVSNGTASSLTHSSGNRTFTFTLTPDNDGTVEASIPAGAIRDLAGNNNTASNQLSIISDRTAFRPALSTTAASPTNTASISVTVDFGESINITTFEISDIAVTGGTASSLAHSSGNRTFTFELTPDNDGTVEASIPAGRVADPAGNANAASNLLEMDFDGTSPKPALSTTAASPTNAASISVTVDFGESINATTFDLSDITVSNGTASSLTHSSGNRTFTFTLTPDNDGTVEASIPAGAIRDLAGNNNTASNQLSIISDRTAFRPALSTTVASPTNTASISVTVDFDESINITTFEISDIAVTGGTASSLAHSSGNRTFTFELTPDNDGTVEASIPAGRVADPAGNANAASNQLSIISDRTAPEPALSTTAASPTNAASISVTVDFGESINAATFDLSDITVSDGTASSLAHSSGNRTFTFTLTPDYDDTVEVSIPAGAVRDLAGNPNAASNRLEMDFDGTLPLPILSINTTSPTNAMSVIVTVDFGESINATTFDLSDITVSDGTASSLIYSSGNQTFTFRVDAPTFGGTVEVFIPAGRVADPAGNPNAASNRPEIDFDSMPPLPILSINTTSPTNATSVIVTVDFGEPIDGATFTLDDISVTGGDASVPAQEGATTQNYAFTVTPSSDGPVTVSIPADRVKDPAGNNNTVSNALSITFDSAAPAPTLSTDTASPTNSPSVIITVDFGEPIDGATFTLDDISVTGGDASVPAQEGATTQQYAFTVTPSSDGPVTVSIPADRVKDPAGNNNTVSNALSITFDSAAPAPTLSTDTASPTNSPSVIITVDFGEPIDGATFTLDDISVTGGDASVPAQEGATTQQYAFTVTPSSDGPVTVSIPADRVKDPAGNNNTASNPLSVTFDSAAPAPTLSTDAASPTNSPSVTITVDFGEPIDGATFTLDDISVTGGDASVPAQEGATTQNYAFTVTPSSDGPVTVSIPADRVRDPAGNNNTVSNALSITFDSAAPAPTLSTDAASPTNAASVTVAVDFGEPIDGATFTLADISVAGGTASSLSHQSGNQTFTFTITPDADGPVVASIPAGRVTDHAGNGNTASNPLSVTFDRTGPAPILSSTTASLTSADSATITVDFGEPIDAATFTASDISITGGTVSGLAHSSANRTFTFQVTPGSDGQVTVSIPADRVKDPAGNNNTASNPLSVTFDSAAPAPTLSTDAASPTNSPSVTITVDFGEPIDGATFTLDDISVTGGDASVPAQEGATTQQYAFTVTPSSDGQVTASIPADRVKDPAGNNNTASNPLSVTFDSAAPAPTLSTDAASPTNSPSVTITVDFGEPIDGATFTLDDISVTGGDASVPAQEGATTQQYAFTVTPSSDGQVTASIPADRVKDPAGNNNTASNPLSVTFDSAAPAPTLSTDAASPTNSPSVTITVDFGEPIDGATFTLDDISVTGGDASVPAQEGATTQQYAFTVTPSSDGQVTVSIPADRVKDPAGNNNTASNPLSVTFDSAAPAPTLSTDAASPTNSPSVTITVDFGEPIDGATFTLDDISVTGGDASGPAQEGATTQQYAFTVTPSSDGQVTASIPADRVKDPAGNNNTVSNALSITFDSAAPAPTLSTDTASPTNSPSVTITVDFGEPIDGATFTLDDISVTGGDASVPAQEGATTQQYAFTVTPSSDGPVTASIPADRVKDPAGNNNTVSNALSITFDSAAPAPTLSTDAASPTNSPSVTITVDFGEPIDGATFTLDDISVTGGDASVPAQEGATTQQYAFTVTPSSDGPVTASIPADRVKDPAGNNNTVSNALSITFDSAAPAPTLSTDAASPTNSPSVIITVDFGEPINATTFALADDVTVTGGTVSGLAHLSGNRTFTFTLAPTSDGTATVAVPAGGVKDESGNLNTASDTLSITFDRTAFKPSLTADATSPTNSPSVIITVDFGEPINATTFALADDVTVTGGTVSGLAHLSGNRTFTFTLAPTSDGTATVAVPAGGVKDESGNLNTASDTLSITFDRTAFKPSLTADATSPTNSPSVIITVDFGEPINATTFALADDVTVTGGAVSGLAHLSGNRTFTFTLVPDGDGTATVAVPAGGVKDESGNLNTASDTLSITFDRTAFKPSLTADATSPTNSPSVIITVDFGEPINATTFALADDVTVTGGTVSGLAHLSGNRTFTFTLAPTSDGTATVAVPAGGVKDESGNLNTASDTLSITFDRTAFKPSLTADATSPTNSPSVTITVDFGEPINATTFALADDVTVTGGTVSGLAHLSGNRTFTFTLVPDGDGTATVAVPAGGVKDESGNLNTASDTLSITFDRTAFKPSLTADATSPTNSPSVIITVDFGEPINATTFALADDVTVTGGTVSGLAHLSGNRTFTFTLVPDGDGTATVAVPAGGVKDESGNLNTASDTLSITFDRTAFKPSLTADATSPTNSPSVIITVDFGEPINAATFALADDVTVTGGAVSGLAHLSGNRTFTFILAPTSDGTATVAVPAGGVKDESGNLNTASDTLSITFDRTAFKPSLTADATSPTNSPSVTVTVDFGEPIDAATFTLADISVTGGTASNLAHSSANRTFTFTLAPTSDGTATVAVPAGGVKDESGNLNTASDTLSITFDRTAFKPSLTADATSPTNSPSVTITVDFGEPIDAATFTLADISVTGGTASNLAHSSANRTFTFTLAPTSDGTATVAVPAGGVKDESGNLNTASDTLSITFDRTAPGPALSTDAVSPTNFPSVTITVDFGEPIDATTFALADDVTVTGGAVSGLAHLSGNRTFTFTLAPDGDGTATVAVPAGGVKDESGNLNTASDTLSITFDRTAFKPSLTADATSPTNSPSVTITVDFGEPINATTFALADISVTGGTASNLAHSSASQNFTFTITPDTDGQVTTSIPAGGVKDESGNLNTASDTLSITFDRTAFKPSLTADATSPTNSPSVTITVDFGEPINATTFALADISVTGGTASNLAHSSASQNFTFTITPDTDGQVTTSIPAGGVTDPAGNDNTASDPLSITFDRTAPAPTLSTDAASPTNFPSVTVTVDFGEPINAATFALADDVTVTGGTVSRLAPLSGNRTFTFTLVPDGDGTATVAVPAGGVKDESGNLNTASDTLSITFDRTAFKPSLTADAPSPTNFPSVTVTVDFGEPINAATFALADDVTVTGGTVSRLAHLSGNRTFTFILAPTSDGTATVAVPAGGVKDESGNLNTASDTLSITFDRTAFKPSLTADATSPTNAASVTVAVDFGEPINAATFTLDDISVTGGDASGLAQEGATTQQYAFTVTPSSDGQVTVSIPAGRVTDPAGNNNTASNPLSVTFDRTAPAPTLSTDTTSPTNAASVTVTVDFGEPINAATFALAEDVTVTGGAVSGLAHLSGNRTFTFALTPTSDGTATVAIPAGRVVDPAGNANAASEPLSVVFDTAPPNRQPSADQTGPAPNLSSPDPLITNADSITVVVDFGEPIVASSFTISDIRPEGGGSTATGLHHLSGNQTFAFTITSKVDGMVLVWMAADRVEDLSGNPNLSSGLHVANFDRVDPTLTIDPPSIQIAEGDGQYELPAGSCDDNDSGPVSPIPVINRSAIDPDTPGTYKAIYTCTDMAGNSGQAALDVRVVQGGTASWSDHSGSSDPPIISTNAPSHVSLHSIQATVKFSEAVNRSTFAASDIVVTGGSASILSYSSYNRTVALQVTAASEGSVTILIHSNSLKYDSGKSNTASNLLRIMFDWTAPHMIMPTDDPFQIAQGNHLFTLPIGTCADEPPDPFSFNMEVDSSAIDPDTPGTYTAIYTCTDMAGNTATATLTVLVVPSSEQQQEGQHAAPATSEQQQEGQHAAPATADQQPANLPPAVDAGRDASHREGLSVTLAGTATDPDGDHLTYLWTHDSDLEVALINADSPSVSFTAPRVDADTVITFTLTATDPHDASSSDSVRITVVDAPVPPPLAQPPAPVLSSTDGAPLDDDAAVTVDFGGPIKQGTFTARDVEVDRGDAFGLSASPGGQLFTFMVTHNDADDDTGRLTVRIPAGAVIYPDGSTNPASNVLSLTFDRRGPAPAISTDAASPTSASSMTIAVNFGEPVTSLDLADVLVVGGTASGLSRAGPTASFAVAPDGDGTVTVQIPADAVKDLAGNPGSASNRIAVLFDATPPTVTLGATILRIPLNASSYALPEGACGDATSGPVSTAPAVAHSINASAAGDYQITYECYDGAGNVGRAYVTATVYEPARSAVQEGPPVRNATVAVRGASSVTLQQGYHADPGAACRSGDGTVWDATSSFTDVATSGSSVRNYYADLGVLTITYTCGGHYDASATRTVTVTDAPPVFDWDDYPDYVLCVDITDGVRVVDPDGNGVYACTDSHGHAITATGRP